MPPFARDGLPMLTPPFDPADLCGIRVSLSEEERENRL
jgi:hypothetical protein